MTTFVSVVTGKGTSTQAQFFFGPFSGTKKRKAFVEDVQGAIAKLENSSVIACEVVNQLPAGWGVIHPTEFRGFSQLRG